MRNFQPLRFSPRHALLAAAIALSVGSTVAEDLTSRAATLAAEHADQSSLPGAEQPWRFLVKELRHLGKGDLSQIDRSAANVEGTDPLPVITAYISALKDLGVTVWMVPVPAKAALEPQKLDANLPAPTASTLAAFLPELEKAGAHVIDLTALYLNERAAQPDRALYCATDSHWSPHGAALAARAVAEAISDEPAVRGADPTAFTVSAPEDLAFHGDLLTAEEKASLPAETLPLTTVAPATTGSSPVLVMGDSHCQVFHSGGSMHASGGGFIDHLAAALSLPVEEISSQASGADQPRVDIARRTVKEPDFWERHPVLIWLFTEREFTEGRWREIPARVVR